MSRPTPTERANAFPIPLTGTGRVADRVFRDRLAAQFAEVEADARREAVEEVVKCAIDKFHGMNGPWFIRSEITKVLHIIGRKLAEPREEDDHL